MHRLRIPLKVQKCSLPCTKKVKSRNDVIGSGDDTAGWAKTVDNITC